MRSLLDDEGQLLIESEHGIGVVTDRDLSRLLDAVLNAAGLRASEPELLALMRGDYVELILRWASGSFPLAAIHMTGVAARYGYTATPAPTESGLSV